MTEQIEVGNADDPDFIEVVRSLVKRLLDSLQPGNLVPIQINNRFDHKWLGFSGVGTVDFEFPEFMGEFDAAKSPFYQDKLTLPPFTPKRILTQRQFEHSGAGHIEVLSEKTLHAKGRKASRSNLHRRVEDRSDSICLTWYSSNTISNDSASVMVYAAIGAESGSWFASFKRDQRWELSVTKGVSRDAVLTLLASRSVDGAVHGE